MEKLNKEQEHILDLIEQKSFNELSSEELNSCLKYYSSSELELLFKMKITEKEITNIYDPEPIKINRTKNKTLVVPLYQAALALAACIVICWFIFKDSGTEIQYITKEVTQIDTLIREKLNYDTITLIVEKKIYVPKTEKKTPELIQLVMDDVTIREQKVPLDLSNMNLENKGASFDEDITSILVSPN